MAISAILLLLSDSNCSNLLLRTRHLLIVAHSFFSCILRFSANAPSVCPNKSRRYFAYVMRVTPSAMARRIEFGEALEAGVLFAAASVLAIWGAFKIEKLEVEGSAIESREELELEARPVFEMLGVNEREVETIGSGSIEIGETLTRVSDTSDDTVIIEPLSRFALAHKQVISFNSILSVSGLTSVFDAAHE